MTRSMQERQELGRCLRIERQRWPRSGPRAKGWSLFLSRLGVDDSTTCRYMALDSTVATATTTSGVYFIQGTDGGPIKIGVSQDVAARLRDLQCGSPMPLRVVGLRKGDRDLERTLHKRLAPHRLHGEWFADVPDVRAAIAEDLP